MKKKENRHFILDMEEQPKFAYRIKQLIKYVLRTVYTKIVMLFIRVPERTGYKYNVAVCSIFKNEAPYLKEWIVFNHIVGVEHFYLYNNNSEDDYYSILKPYIASGLVTLIQWPKNQAQMECYNDCIENYRSDTKWLGFIDIDEFIVPKKQNDIYSILRTFEKKSGAVKIYWKMFGTSGMMDRNVDTLVTEKFVVSWSKYYSVGKCFYNTSFDFDFIDRRNRTLHHVLWTKIKGISVPPVNLFGRYCMDGMDFVPDDDHPVQINHYFTKSFSEYAMKKSKGDVYFKNNPHDEEYFYLHELENTSVDYSAYKYLIKLKKELIE